MIALLIILLASIFFINNAQFLTAQNNGSNKNIIDKTKSFTKIIQLINIYNEKSLLKNNNKKIIKKCLHIIILTKYID